MTTRDDVDATTASDDIADILRRVRELDPGAEEVAVRGYVEEIAAASDLLDTIELTGVPLEVSFSAAWPEGFPT